MDPTAAAPPADRAKGTIHDLGYQRYVGPRRPPGRRYWVIARNVVAVAMRSRWGTKLPVLGAGMTFLGAATIMAVTGSALRADRVIVGAIEFCSFWGFLLAVNVAAAAVADDLKLGAFQFYFSRPIRPHDYVAGKLLGLSFVVGLAMFVVPVGLAIMRLLIIKDVSELADVWTVVPRAAALGAAGTIALVLPAAGFGALMQSRWPARAAYAIYYLVIGGIAAGLSEGLEKPWIQLISTFSDFVVVGRAVMGRDPRPEDPSAWAAGAALVFLSFLGWAIIWRRVKNAETAGLGSG